MLLARRDGTYENDRYRIVRALEVFELTGTTLSEHFRRQELKAREEAPPRFVMIGLKMEREALRRRIRERTSAMYAEGWPDEVRALLAEGADPACPGLRTLGYPETIRYVRGEIGLEEAQEEIAKQTAAYAKRQMTWFRKERGVTWFDAGGRDLAGAVLNGLDRSSPSW